jgi:hypothetical protein
MPSLPNAECDSRRAKGTKAVWRASEEIGLRQKPLANKTWKLGDVEEVK